MDTAKPISTAERLFQASGLGRCELIRGELNMMSPGGSMHGWVSMNVAGPLREFVRRTNAGKVFGAETGFLIARDPDTVRAPDGAFVAARRLPGEIPRGFFPGPPDISLEVVSPHDRPGELEGKVRDWLQAGCQEVWIADPEKKTVIVHRPNESVHVLTTADHLTTSLLPGFSLAVGEIFAM